jgi:hypothetical protein
MVFNYAVASKSGGAQFPCPGAAKCSSDRYFGASLDHSVLAVCFLAFIIGRSDEYLSVRGLSR